MKRELYRIATQCPHCGYENIYLAYNILYIDKCPNCDIIDELITHCDVVKYNIIPSDHFSLMTSKNDNAKYYGPKSVLARVSIQFHKHLKSISVDNDVDMQDMIIDALVDKYFAKKK